MSVAIEPATAGRYASARGLQGIQKCAVLMVALGEERAAEIFRHLSPTEVEALSLEIAKAPKVPSDVCDDVVTEAVQSVLAEDYVAEGGVDYARSLLQKSLGGDLAEEIIARLSATIERRPFEFLRRTPPEQIHVFLKNESPQTIALVVASLHTALAAQVLALLDPEDQADVATRVATMGETRPDVVTQIESVMKQKLSTVIAAEYSTAGGVKSLDQLVKPGTERFGGRQFIRGRGGDPLPQDGVQGLPVLVALGPQRRVLLAEVVRVESRRRVVGRHDGLPTTSMILHHPARRNAALTPA